MEHASCCRTRVDDGVVGFVSDVEIQKMSEMRRPTVAIQNSIGIKLIDQRIAPILGAFSFVFVFGCLAVPQLNMKVGCVLFVGCVKKFVNTIALRQSSENRLWIFFHKKRLTRFQCVLCFIHGRRTGKLILYKRIRFGA